MLNITVISESITRLTLPYKDIFTTVYAIKHPKGDILFDAASYDEDISAYLLPFLKEVGISRETLKYVFISHNHTDHSGGLFRLMEEFPNLCIVSASSLLQEKYKAYDFLLPKDREVIMEDFLTVAIPGHTQDSMALFDLRTNTLITGDCLQLYGIFGSQDWGSNIRYPAEHMSALASVRKLKIDEIICAHDYHPYGYRAIGNDACMEMLDACEQPLQRLKGILLENPTLTDAEIRVLYNTSDRIPPITVHVVAAMREALENGTTVK